MKQIKIIKEGKIRTRSPQLSDIKYKYFNDQWIYMCQRKYGAYKNDIMMTKSMALKLKKLLNEIYE